MYSTGYRRKNQGCRRKNQGLDGKPGKRETSRKKGRRDKENENTIIYF